MRTTWTCIRATLPDCLDKLGVTVAAYRKASGGSYRRIEPAASQTVIILGVGTPWRVSGPSTPFGTHQAFAAGLAMRPLEVFGDDPLACIEVRLPPSVAAGFFRTTLYETDGVVGIADLLGRDSGGLVDAVANARDVATATGDVVGVLAADLTDNAPQAAPEVLWAWRRIVQANGQVAIRQLAQEIGWSERHFAARFRGTIGLAPKAAARLARFSRAHRQVVATDRPLAQIAVEAGYSDQSHMSREFKSLAGAAPNRLRRSLDADVLVYDAPQGL